MSVYFARHGRTDDNDHLKQTSGLVPVSDVPLNELGVEQADELAEQLKSQHFDMIISSPLLRAKQTSEIVNRYHNLPIIIDNSFQELRVGKYLDQSVWGELFDIDKNIRNNDDAETVTEFFTRVYKALDNLKEKYADKEILIVSHGGVNQAFHAYFNKLKWHGNMRLDRTKNAEIRKYDFKK